MINTSLIVYENEWIIRRIYEVADGLRTAVVDQTKFEERCINRVARYLSGGKNRTSHRNYIERLIQQEASDYRRRGKKEDAERSEEHTSELQSRGHLVCRLLLEKKK